MLYGSLESAPATNAPVNVYLNRPGLLTGSTWMPTPESVTPAAAAPVSAISPAESVIDATLRPAPLLSVYWTSM